MSFSRCFPVEFKGDGKAYNLKCPEFWDWGEIIKINRVKK